MSRPYLCPAKPKVYDELKRCRTDVPDVFQVTLRDGHRSLATQEPFLLLYLVTYRTDILLRELVEVPGLGEEGTPYPSAPGVELQLCKSISLCLDWARGVIQF